MRKILLIAAISMLSQAQAQDYLSAMKYPPPYQEMNCVENQLGEDGARNWKWCHITYSETSMQVWAYKGNSLKWTCTYRPATKNVVVKGRTVVHTYNAYTCS